MTPAEKAFEKRKARLAREKEISEYEKTTVEYRRGLTHDEKARMFKLVYREPWPDEEDRDDPYHDIYVECDVCGAYRNTDNDDFLGHIASDRIGEMWFCEECWQSYLAEKGDESDDWYDEERLYALSNWRQLGSESESESDDD